MLTVKLFLRHYRAIRRDTGNPDALVRCFYYELLVWKI